MNQYRIIVLDRTGAELSSGYLFALDDDGACASAQRLMHSNERATSVQVLKDRQLVCSYERA